MQGMTEERHRMVLNWHFNTGAVEQPAQPTTTFVRLHTGDPGTTGDDNQVDGAVWTNYSHQEVNNDGSTAPFWTVADDTVDYQFVENNGEVDFGDAALTAQIELSHVSVVDNADNVLYAGPLQQSQPVVDGNPVKFPTGSISLRLRRTNE